MAPRLQVLLLEHGSAQLAFDYYATLLSRLCFHSLADSGQGQSIHLYGYMASRLHGFGSASNIAVSFIITTWTRRIYMHHQNEIGEGRIPATRASRWNGFY